MSLFYLYIMGRVGALILGAVGYGFIMHILGVRILLRPFSVKIVEPTGHIRGAFVQIIEKRMKKHPTEEGHSINVHKQLMRRTKKLRIQTSIGFFVLIVAMISGWV